MTKKTLLSIFLVFAMVITLAVPAFASAEAPLFDVTAKYDSTKGEVELSDESAAEGETVEIEITPKYGYIIDDVTATSESGEVTLTGNTNLYAFTMPAEAVEVSVTFKIGYYKVEKNYSSRYGAVNFNTDFGGYGTYIEFTVDSRVGYSVYNVEVVGNTSNEYFDVELNGGYYSFNLPAENVTVVVTFTESDEITYDYYADLRYDDNFGYVELSQDSADQGTTVNIYVEPDNDDIMYSIKVYTVTDSQSVTVRDISDYHYFIMPDDNVTVTVEFYGSGAYYASTNYDESCGSVRLDTYSADAGERVKIYATPDAGYEVSSVRVIKDEGGAVTVRTASNYRYFSMPSDDVTVYVTFTKSNGDYNVELDYDFFEGEVNISAYKADEGDTVNIYVDPENGYAVDGVAVYKNGTTETVTVNTAYDHYYFTMPASNVTVYVEFIEIEGDYYVDLFYEEEHGYVEVDAIAADQGATIRIYIDPELGYDVYDVEVTKNSGSGSSNVTVRSTNSYYYFTMPDSDVTVWVEFIKLDGDYYIDVDYDDDYGYVDLSTYSADRGETVRIYVEPDDDCEVVDVEVEKDTKNGGAVTVRSTSNYYYFTMPACDVIVTVTFDGEESSSSGAKHDIDLFYDDNYGDAELSVNRAKEDTIIKIYVYEDDNEEVEGVVVSKNSNGELIYVRRATDYYYFFTMPDDDVFVDVIFEGETDGLYEIDLDYIAAHGNVELSAEETDRNNNVRVYITPEEGYELLDVTVTRDSGASRTVKVTPYTDYVYCFTMPAADVTVDVTFKKTVLNYAVNIDNSSVNGTVTASTQVATAGTPITITAAAKTGYAVDKVTVTEFGTTKAVTVTESKGVYTFVMPAASVNVNVTFKVVPTEVIHICSLTSFTDVDTKEWYHEALDYVVMNGIMNGMGGNIFAPGGTTTRAMVTTVLWRLAGSPVSTAPLPYADIPANEWYTEAVRWAAANGILVYVSTSNNFEPNSTITREQFASMIYLFEQYKAGGTIERTTYEALYKFSDTASLSVWAYDSMNWCNKNGIINGNANGTLNPKGSTTRAELAQILFNYKDFN